MKNNFDQEIEDQITPEINLTPLIDIMLVLLIIFMVTSSVSNESGLDISLPKTSHSKTTITKDKNIIVSLKKDGQIFIDGKLVAHNLNTLLEQAIKNSTSKIVVFEGDKQATLGATVNLIDLAKKFGAKQFALATENK